MDGSDMMLREDIAKLWTLLDDSYAVMVVQHPEFTGGTFFWQQFGCFLSYAQLVECGVNEQRKMPGPDP